MTPYEIYLDYATTFEEITNCEPMTFDEWLELPEADRPGMEDTQDFRNFPDVA